MFKTYITARNTQKTRNYTTNKQTKMTLTPFNPLSPASGKVYTWKSRIVRKLGLKLWHTTNDQRLDLPG